MANQEQLEILKQGVEVWNKWREENTDIKIDLEGADLSNMELQGANLHSAHLYRANLTTANLRDAVLTHAELGASAIIATNLSRANLEQAILIRAAMTGANLQKANLRSTTFTFVNLDGAALNGSDFSGAVMHNNTFRDLDLSEVIGLADVVHKGPSSISSDVFSLSRGKIPEVFLRGCGLSDADIEYGKICNPELSNEEISKSLYKIYDLRASQAIQISRLFISYSHADGKFVDKIGTSLYKMGIRYWRDIHDMKAGRMEKQLDYAIRQNPTVLLVLSKHSLKSDWVEHEVRKARELEKRMGRDVLCPVALDSKWKDSSWPKRVMEQVMEYNILDFSAWKDDSKFGNTFAKLIDGLGLFYKG